MIGNVRSGQAYMLTGQEGYERPIMLNKNDAQKQQVNYRGDVSRR